MELVETIKEIEKIQARQWAALPGKLRPYFEVPNLDSRGVLVVGARGVGKTTFLLHKTKDLPFLYVSVDLPWIVNFSLWDIAQSAFMQGYEGIIFDEVHYAKDWSKNLKAIYDAFPQKKVWASDSSSVFLRKGIADLSRRFITHSIPLLSFREYIYLKKGILLEKLDPFTVSIAKCKEIFDQVNVLALFREYLITGFRPIFEEGHYQEKILNILEKTIYSDLPFFLPEVHENYLRLLNAVVGFLAQSDIPTINVEAMCKEWSIGKEKLYQLLAIMEQMHLIRIIKHCGSKKIQTKGAKIFLYDPSFYHVLNGKLGSLREAYVVSQFQDIKHEVCCPKDDRICDFIVNQKLKIEVGGRSKELKQADFVVRDDLDFPVKKTIPLWLLGMQY